MVTNQLPCDADTNMPTPTSERSAKRREQDRAYVQRRLAEDPDYLRRKAAEFYARKKEQRIAINMRWREKVGFKERPDVVAKARARSTLRTAVWRGKVVKPADCPRCGEPTPPMRLHAHHADYSKPLEVTWLCTTCHGKEHRKAA